MNIWKHEKRDPNLILILFLFAFFLFLAWFYQLPLYLSDRYDWYVALGNRYFLSSKVFMAIEYADKAILLDGRNSAAYGLKINACFNLERYECVMHTLDSLGMLEKSAYYYMQLGSLRSLQGDPISASIYYEKAIEIDPSYAPSYALLGLLKIKQGDLDAASRYLNQSLILTPQTFTQDDPYRLWTYSMTHMGYALVYEKKGEHEKADLEKKKAIAYRAYRRYGPRLALTLAS